MMFASVPWWGYAIVAAVFVIALAYAIPKTRPYAKVVLLTLLAGALLLLYFVIRAKRGESEGDVDNIAQGPALAATLDRLNAQSNAAKLGAKLDLQTRKAASAEEATVLSSKVTEAQQIPDPFARSRRLTELYEESKNGET